MSQRIESGARVLWARQWLRAVGGHGIGHAMGTVESVNGHLAYVRWDDEPQRAKPCIVRNLVRADRRHLETY